MTDTTNPVVTQLAALTVEARRIADALTTPLPGEDGLPVNTCPRTDRHGYHMWPERPDAPSFCPGHPAPEAARTAPDTPLTRCSPACSEGHTYEPPCEQAPPPGTCVWPDCLTDGQQAELAEDVRKAMLGEATVPAPDQQRVCGCRESRFASGGLLPTRTLKPSARTTPDNPPTSSSEAQECSEDTTRHVGTSTIGEPATPGRATITIAVTAPNQDNANRWAGTIRDLVTAEHGHHMRLDITISDGQQYEQDSSDNGLREQYTAALRDAITSATTDDANDLVPAVLAVRDDELAEWRDLAKSALKEVEQQTERGDDAEVTIARVRDLHQPDPDGRTGWCPDDDDTPGAYGNIAQACQSCGSNDTAVRWPCPTIRALDSTASAAAEPSPDSDTCRPLEINGDTIRVHGSHDLTDQERSYASDIADAAKRKFTADQAQPSDRPRCPDCGLTHNLTPGSRPMSLCQRTRDRNAAEPDPIQAQPTIPTTKES